MSKQSKKAIIITVVVVVAITAMFIAIYWYSALHPHAYS